MERTKDVWEMDARSPTDYHVVEARRGREFIFRMTTGADVWLAFQKFARDHRIRFAKLHAAFMGGLPRVSQGCRRACDTSA